MICKCGKKATTGLFSENPKCDDCMRKALQKLNLELNNWVKK